MSYLTFKNVTDIGQLQSTNQLVVNLSLWFDWAFLSIGSFYNVNRNISGVYGGSPSYLRSVSDPNYINGCVWESARSNWVYETGITYQYNNINYSGIYINNNFYEYSTTGVYSHAVDFPKGRVIFDNPISVTGNIIECEYSFKYINVLDSNNQVAKTLMFDSMRFDSPQFNQIGSGIWNKLSQSRVQLPAIIIDPTSRIRHTPYELGGGVWRYQDILLHVIAETPYECNNITDILLNQKDKTIFLFDVDRVDESGLMPLDYRGDRATNGLMYPDLVKEENGYRLRRCLIDNSVSDSYPDLYNGLYRSVVQWTCKINVPSV